MVSVIWAGEVGGSWGVPGCAALLIRRIAQITHSIIERRLDGWYFFHDMLEQPPLPTVPALVHALMKLGDRLRHPLLMPCQWGKR